MFEPLRKYATFKGRARRLEYWSFQLLLVLVFTVLFIWFSSAVGTGQFDTSDPVAVQAAMEAAPGAMLPATLIALASLFFILPTLAVAVRRLHDADRSGWWILIGLTGIGSLILFIFYLLDGTKGPNRHGADPKGRTLS